MPIDLYLSVFSPPCRTVQFVAKHLGIDVILKDIDVRNGDHLKPEYIKLNPQHTIPTIDDNGFVLWESRAIAQYLCNKYAPDFDLYPRDPNRRAVVDRVLNFDIGSFVPSIRQVLGVKLMDGLEPSEDKVKAFNDNLKLLDTFIGDNKYVAGTNLTIADLSLFSMLGSLKTFDSLLSEYPRITEWVERLETELPYYEELQGNVNKLLPAIYEQMRNNPAMRANITTKMQ